MIYLLKMVTFHCYTNLKEGISLKFFARGYITEILKKQIKHIRKSLNLPNISMEEENIRRTSQGLLSSESDTS